MCLLFFFEGVKFFFFAVGLGFLGFVFFFWEVRVFLRFFFGFGFFFWVLGFQGFREVFWVKGFFGFQGFKFYDSWDCI